MNAEHFTKISTPRGSDLIIKEIWDLIKTGVLSPGDKLPSEQELMKKFGVSKAVLREALNTLEAYGHITKKRGAYGGSIILDITPDKGIGLILDYLKTNANTPEYAHEMMRILVRLIIPSAVKNMNSEGLKRIEDLVQQHHHDFKVHGGSPCGWKFPILLAELSENPFLYVFMQIVMRSIIDFELSHGIGDISSSELEIKYNRIAYELNVESAHAVLNGDSDAAIRIMDEKGKELFELLA